MTLYDQTCPHCGITEAAGGYCTACERPTRPEWLHRPVKGARDPLRLNALRAGKAAATATRRAKATDPSTKSAPAAKSKAGPERNAA